MATTMPNVINSANASQMSTPLKNLPLKTTQQNENDIEDPLIQGVLKDFEETVGSQQQDIPMPSSVMHSPEVHYDTTIEQPSSFIPPSIPEPVQMNHLNYNSNNSNNTNKKLFDLDILKRATIVTIILVLFQNNMILNLGLSRLPSSVSSHITGREIFMNSFLVFVIIYALMYFEFI